MDAPGRVALLAGASGLVGSHLLQLLLDDPRWDRVVSVGRREVDVHHEKLEQRLVQLPQFDDLPAVDDAFSALGTTIKKAGSQAVFRSVDHDAVVAFARAARLAGATTFQHVTSLGADADSRMFYTRVKGETERDVAAVGIATTVAFRPSMIDGQRPDPRSGEHVGLVVMRALAPVLGKFRPTLAADVAAAMLAEAGRGQPGARTIGPREITALA